VVARCRAEASLKTRCPGSGTRPRTLGPSWAPLPHAPDSPRQAVSEDPTSRPCPATLRGSSQMLPLLGNELNTHERTRISTVNRGSPGLRAIWPARVGRLTPPPRPTADPRPASTVDGRASSGGHAAVPIGSVGVWLAARPARPRARGSRPLHPGPPRCAQDASSFANGRQEPNVTGRRGLPVSTPRVGPPIDARGRERRPTRAGRARSRGGGRFRGRPGRVRPEPLRSCLPVGGAGPPRRQALGRDRDRGRLDDGRPPHTAVGIQSCKRRGSQGTSVRRVVPETLSASVCGGCGG